MKTLLTIGGVFLALGLLWGGPALAQGYGAHGRMGLNVGHDALLNPVDYESEIPAAPLTHIEDSYLLVNPDYGDEAGAEYIVDIHNGSIQAVAGVQTFSTAPFARASATMRAGFWDTLTFTVAPGYYPAGAEAVLSGRITGSHERGGPATEVMGAQALVSFGEGFLWSDPLGPGEQGPVDDPFQITRELVAPGTTVDEAFEVELLVEMWLEPLASLVGGDSYALSDYRDTLKCESLAVTEGVTWTSASGVFLPEPATLSLLALGGLALLRRRRR